ncbi:MGT family glycosyltransferase [Duganella sp. 1411]|uniref:glycosyltransferase n=1 Tax=Duganella sp. 1411 TaxID=2806572 RepID=UPI001AE99FC7|nr:nucleotide disphospho-sugar-binding domain-containing protein [Duganella sp. 1411]MBP1207489.1 MGT family glycosyltransferase [Duganella sp. 1411]
MAHFGVVAPAFYSHFNALAALALALIARGHRVTFLHRPDAAAWITDARIGFHALGADRYPPGSLAASLRLAANPGSPLGLRKVIVDMADTTDMLCRELPAALEALRVDALLGDQMEAAAGLVAEALGMPFISIACALPVNREPGIPLPVMPFEFGTGERALKMYEGSARVYDWLMAPHRKVIERQARGLGIPARAALHECLSPLAQISQTVAGFDFPRRNPPPYFHHVGPLRHTASAHGGDALPAIAGDRPFIFASLGTLQGQRFALFKRIARACRALDAQLLVAHCGGLNARQAQAIESAGPAGATTVCAFAPQQAALARADAVVSHAGLNTAMDAIAARTPILALPIAFDQPGVAARISHAGIGLRASPRFAGAEQLAARLRRLLADPAYAQQLAPLAAQLAQAGGTQRAADIVEAALGLNAQASNEASARA